MQHDGRAILNEAFTKEKRKKRYAGLSDTLKAYAARSGLDFHQYSPYHMRLIDPDYTTIDCWTTGRYWVKQTNYYLQSRKPIIERMNEKGWLPAADKITLWLDQLFYAADM